MAGNAPIYAILREARERAQGGRCQERRGEGRRRSSRRRARRSRRGSQGRPARRRQRRTEHDRRAPARFGARQRGTPVQDRCADRSHVLTRPQVLDALAISAIAASSVALNSWSLCSAVSPSVSALEKLAMTPLLRASFSQASSRP